jgi:TetR/AcrR family transcriptional repressor of nem operon
MSTEKYDKGCLIGNCKTEMANHEKSITNFLEGNQNRMLLLLEDLISKGQEDSLINTKQSSKDYALYLYSSLQGFRMTGILITERTQLKSIVKSILQTIS